MTSAKPAKLTPSKAFFKSADHRVVIGKAKIIARNLGLRLLSEKEVIDVTSKYKPHLGRKELAKAAKRAARNKGNHDDNSSNLQHSGSGEEARNQDRDETSTRESEDKIS
jgi:hypothetical protein